jgi:ATP-binding cassette subfamily B protein
VTSVVIAHRLSTILSADLICYVEGGKIIESGSLDALLAKNGPFARLYEQQFGTRPTA